jgi:hypothetical protein
MIVNAMNQQLIISFNSSIMNSSLYLILSPLLVKANLGYFKYLVNSIGLLFSLNQEKSIQPTSFQRYSFDLDSLKMSLLSKASNGMTGKSFSNSFSTSLIVIYSSLLYIQYFHVTLGKSFCISKVPFASS